MANFTPQEIEEMLQEFFSVVGKRQYTGARYVPVFGRRGESSIIWDNSAPYEPLTIVLYQGNSFTSRTYVPEGIDISDTAFWANTGNYNAQVEAYRQEVASVSETVATNTENIATNTENIATNTENIAANIEDITDINNYIENVEFDFPNVAAMVACSELTENSICRTDGFHESGDGGNAIYKITDSETPNGMNVIALDNGLNAELLLGEQLNVKQIGCYGDGTHDDTTYIQAAINLLESLKDDYTERFTKGFTLLIPEGCYKVSNTITITKSNILIEGVGASTVFYAYAPDFNIFSIDGTSRNIYGSAISNVRFYTPNASAGANIKLTNVLCATFENIVSSSAYQCLDIDSCAVLMLSKFIIDATDRQAGLGTGYLVDIHGTNSTPSDIHLTDFQIRPNFLNQAYTLRIRKCDGIYFENLHIHGGVLLSAESTTDPLASLFFTNCYFDGATDCNVKFEGTNSSFRNIYFNNCYFRYATRNLYVYTDVENVFVNNCKFAQAKLSAIEVFGGKTLKSSVFNNILFSDTNTNGELGSCCILMRGKGNIITNVTVNNSDPTAIQLGTFINLSSTSEYCIVDLVNTINSYIQANTISNNGSNNVIGTNVIFGQSS